MWTKLPLLLAAAATALLCLCKSMLYSSRLKASWAWEASPRKGWLLRASSPSTNATHGEGGEQSIATTSTVMHGNASHESIVLAKPNDTPPPSPRRRLNGTIVVQLMGELGNNLAILAYAFAVRAVAAEEFHLDLALHVRKQKARKADRAAADLGCLPSFRGVDFDECRHSPGNSGGSDRGKVCADKIDRQNAVFSGLMRQNNNATILRLGQTLEMGGSTSDEVRSFLRAYAAMLQDDTIMDLFRTKNKGWNSHERHPFLYSIKRLHASDDLIDEFYSRGLPEYFAFDDATKMSSGCCALLPAEDEQVFHYRSFVRDLPNMHMAWGGAELIPERAAEMLTASLPPGTKVAVVAGRASLERVLAYKAAFEGKSFVARTVTGQTGIQDFCFLSHARAGLWGTRQSSYATWASLIGKQLRNATLYGANYPARERNATVRVATNADLAKRVHFPVLRVLDEDVW